MDILNFLKKLSTEIALMDIVPLCIVVFGLGYGWYFECVCVRLSSGITESHQFS